MPAHDPESTDPLQPTDRDSATTSPADDADTSADADAGVADAGADLADAPTELPARVSRQPRMGRFLGLGAIVGLLLALVLTMLWPDDPNYVPDNPTLSFSDLQVFGFLAVYLVPICLGIFGLIGYFLGRAAEKRSRTEIVIGRTASGDDDTTGAAR